MSEDRSSQPYTILLESLPLTLVDGGGEGRCDWELSAGPLEWILIGFWDEGDPRDEDFSACLNNPALEDLVVNTTLEHETCPIAETLSRVDIPQQHQGHVGLQVEQVGWESIGVKSVEILYVEPEGVLWILHSIGTAEWYHFSRQPVLHHVIDCLHLLVCWSQYCPSLGS